VFRIKKAKAGIMPANPANIFYMNDFTMKRLYVGDFWFEATRTELFTWFGNSRTVEIIQISGEGENMDGDNVNTQGKLRVETNRAGL
jgi:hypothetical protein